MELIQQNNIKILVLDKKEEIIVSTSNNNTGYVSIYNAIEGMRLESLNKKEAMIPYIEREKKRYTKVLKKAERELQSEKKKMEL